MGNIHRLLTRMKRTKQEFDEQMNQHIKDLDKIRQIVKYNYTANGQQEFKQLLGNPNPSMVIDSSEGVCKETKQSGNNPADNFYLDLRGEA